MATATEQPTQVLAGERRFVLYNVGWEGYQTLLELLSDHGVRITYDRGDVELMSPLYIHEHFKKRFAQIIETVTEELDLPRVSAGATTFSKEDLDRGLEPDECYYLANAHRIGKQDRIIMGIDPPPDLVIEIEITRSALDRLGIYAALGISEVWRWSGKKLKVLHLQADRTYAPSETSLAFPFLSLDEIARWALSEAPEGETRWARGFRVWVRETLLPRYQAWLTEQGEGA